MKMVQCPSCGASFADTKECCPYCGNTHTAGAKAAYTGRMQRLREQLFAHTKRAALYRKIALKGLVCVVLFAIATTLTISLTTASDRNIRRRLADADTHADTYALVIDAYLEEKDYLRADEYMDYRAIYIVGENDPHVRYAVIRELLDAYHTLFSDIMDAADDGVLSAVAIDYVPKSMASFYDMCSEDYLMVHPYAGQFDSEETRALAHDLRTELEVLMRYYFHLTEEDVASLPLLSERAMRELLKERIGEE